jgi:hypothetical protein
VRKTRSSSFTLKSVSGKPFGIVVRLLGSNLVSLRLVWTRIPTLSMSWHIEASRFLPYVYTRSCYNMYNYYDIIVILFATACQDTTPQPTVGDAYTLEMVCEQYGLVVQASAIPGINGQSMGFGLVAREEFKAGDVLCYYWGKLLTTAQHTDQQIRQGCVMEFHARKLKVMRY